MSHRIQQRRADEVLQLVVVQSTATIIQFFPRLWEPEDIDESLLTWNREADKLDKGIMHKWLLEQVSKGSS